MKRILWFFVALILLAATPGYATMTTLPPAPSRLSPTTFATDADAFVAALPGFVSQANALETNVVAKEASAVAAANLALAAANYKGAWSSQTGAATIPYSVSHASQYWMLTSNLADVTAKTPGIDAEWLLIPYGDQTAVNITGGKISGVTSLIVNGTNATVRTFNGGTTSHPILNLLNSRGSSDSPTYLQNGDECGAIAIREGTSGFFAGGVGMAGWATEDWSASALGQRLIFFVTPNGTTTKTNTAYFNHDTTVTFVGAVTAPSFTGSGAALTALPMPGEYSQSVRMIGATSGATGITVADAANINFGTGDFSGAVDVLLPTFVPAANVILSQKHDGTNGRIFYIDTTGKLALTINATTYTSTVATGLTANTRHRLGYSVFRETTSVAGAVIFTVDGARLGTTVAITAAATVTTTNTSTQYFMGTDTTRTDGRFYGAALYNRVLSVTELSFDRYYGISKNDKYGGAQADLIKAQNDRDFSSGTIGNWVVANGGGGNSTVTYDAGPAAEETGKITIGATPGTYAAARLTSTYFTALTPYSNIRYAVDLYLPAGHHFTRVVLGNGSSIAGATNIRYKEADLTITGAWQTIYLDISLPATVTGSSIFITSYSSFPSDVLYFDNASLKQIGVVGLYEPAGFQPSPGQCLDASPNKYHAMQPTAGSSLSKYKNEFEYRWTNTWAASSAAQYIGGVNQDVLTAKHFITSIVSRTTVTTDVENITIGDGSDADYYVTAVAPTAAPIIHTLAKNLNDGTNLKLVVTPAAEATMTVEFIVKGYLLE